LDIKDKSNQLFISYLPPETVTEHQIFYCRKPDNIDQCVAD